jgi:hypothetical protein
MMTPPAVERTYLAANTGGMPGPRLSADSRRALAMLATSGSNGATRPLLIAHGFGVPMINAIVSQGLATLTYERVRAGGKLIDVGRIRITDAGQRALKE